MSNQGWQIPAHRPQHLTVDAQQEFLMDTSAAAAAAEAPAAWGDGVQRGAAFPHSLPGSYAAGQQARRDGFGPMEAPWAAAMRRESGMHPELSAMPGPPGSMQGGLQDFPGWDPTFLGMHQLLPSAQLPIYPLTDQTQPPLSQAPMGTLPQWHMEQGFPMFGMPWLDPSGLADLAMLTRGDQHSAMPHPGGLAHPDASLSRRVTSQGASQQPQHSGRVSHDVDVGPDMMPDGQQCQMVSEQGARQTPQRAASREAKGHQREQHSLHDNQQQHPSTTGQHVPSGAGILSRATRDQLDSGRPGQPQAANVAASSHSHGRIHRHPSPRSSFTNAPTLVRAPKHVGSHAPDLHAVPQTGTTTAMLPSSHAPTGPLSPMEDRTTSGVIRPIAMRLVDQPWGEHGHMGPHGPPQPMMGPQHALPRPGASFSAPQPFAPWQHVRSICAWPPGFAPGHTTGILSR